MSTNDNGGPAFPVHPDMASQLGCIPSASDAGMSLRDYFAAKAMVVIIAQDWPYKNVATQAYEIADAMLEARR
jgi:hypothetical protein